MTLSEYIHTCGGHSEYSVLVTIGFTVSTCGSVDVLGTTVGLLYRQSYMYNSARA